MSIEKSIVNNTTVHHLNQSELTITKKRCRIYARVSTRDQLDGFGIDVQISKMKDYLTLYESTEENCVFEQHIDEGVSAKDTNRPALKKMMADIEAGIVDEVIIYKLDRLARSVTDVYKLLTLMIDHNCNLVSVMDHLDIYTANGRMVVGILAVIAQWERETDAERTNDSTVEMLQKQIYPFGNPIFGYKIEDHVLVPDEVTSQAYLHIVNRACDGKLASEICKELKEKFGLNKRDDAIRTMLNKDYYADGKYTYDNNVYENIVPILVTPERLQLARKTLRKRTVIIKNEKYHFHNKIRTVDGDICMCKPTKKKTHYVYYYEHKNKRINQQAVVKQVLFRIIMHGNQTSQNKLKKDLMNKVKSLEKKMDRLFIQYANDAIDDKSYGYSMKKLFDELEELHANHYVASENDMTFDKWNKLSDKKKNAYINQHVESINVDLELKIVVKVNFRS